MCYDAGVFHLETPHIIFIALDFMYYLEFTLFRRRVVFSASLTGNADTPDCISESELASRSWGAKQTKAVY